MSPITFNRGAAVLCPALKPNCSGLNNPEKNHNNFFQYFTNNTQDALQSEMHPAFREWLVLLQYSANQETHEGATTPVILGTRLWDYARNPLKSYAIFRIPW